MEAFDKAKELWKVLPDDEKTEILNRALNSYGELYKKIVFN